MIIMIGDMIGELTGKVTGERVLRRHHGELKIEKSTELKGKILGMDVTFWTTVTFRDRSQGGTFVHGNGIMMTAKGEKVTFHGSGVSIEAKGPGMSTRGVRYAQTTAPAFTRLNNVAIVFEIDAKPDGTIRDKMWEWK